MLRIEQVSEIEIDYNVLIIYFKSLSLYNHLPVLAENFSSKTLQNDS